jgi:hypothetical protein
VPRAGAERTAYKRVGLVKHCTLHRLENGKVLLRPYAIAGTYVNSAKVKLFTTKIVGDGDIVSLVSLENGPWFTFHTDEPSRDVGGVDGVDGNGR